MSLTYLSAIVFFPSLFAYRLCHKLLLLITGQTGQNGVFVLGPVVEDLLTDSGNVSKVSYLNTLAKETPYSTPPATTRQVL